MEAEPNYLALVADLRASRRLADRAAAQRALLAAIEAVSARLGGRPASHPGVAAGDQVQVLFHAPRRWEDRLQVGVDVVTAVHELALRLHPVSVAFGLGLGGVTTDVDPDRVAAVDGPCFHRAVEAARAADGVLLDARGFSENQTLVGAFAGMGVLLEEWTERQAEIVAAALPDGLLAAAGSTLTLAPERKRIELAREVFGVSPSVITESLQAAHVAAYRACAWTAARVVAWSCGRGAVPAGTRVAGIAVPAGGRDA